MDLSDVVKLGRERDRLIEGVDAYTARSDGATWESLPGVGDLTLSVVRGENNLIVRGQGSDAKNSRVKVTGSGNVVFIGPHARFDNADIRIVGNDNLLYFGAFSTLEGMTAMLVGEGRRIEIGDMSMLSARIFFDTSDHHGIYELATGQRINHDADVDVADHVWIGRDVRINKGVTIGTDTIIGQGSVVAGRVPANTLCTGTPARTLREGVTWTRMKADSLEEIRATDRDVAFRRRVADLRAALV